MQRNRPLDQQTDSSDAMSSVVHPSRGVRSDRSGALLNQDVDEVYMTSNAMMLIRTPWIAQTLHRHYPMELVAALDGPIEMRCGNGETIRSDRFLVPPMKSHGLLRYEGRVARLYFDAEYSSVGAWKGKPIRTDIEYKDDLRASLSQLFVGGQSNDAAHATMRMWAEAWITCAEAEKAADPRVVAVLRHLEIQGADIFVDRKSMARLVKLSPSRFAAIFAEDTGSSLSRYLLWHRVKIALSLICGKGASVTSAALAAGFADSAHLTRSCRATYGCPPSHLKRAVPSARRPRS